MVERSHPFFFESTYNSRASNPMNCKNCGSTFEGNYCNQCGQSAKVGRITLSSLAEELSNSLFHVNKGFLYTLVSLFTHPGRSLRDFMEGKRKNFVKPISYVLTLSTIYFLITKLMGQNTWMDDFITGFSFGANNVSDKMQIPAILTWFSNNFGYSNLLLLPVFSFASFLAFRKLGSSYLEHIVLNAYITGQQAFFYALFAVLGKWISSDILDMFPVLIAMTYTFWVFWQFFSSGNRFVNLLRSLFTYFLYLLFSTWLLLLVMGVSEVLG